MEYIYYLTDYYDFENASVLEEQNMLGICRSFELYGKHQDEFHWTKGEIYEY